MASRIFSAVALLSLGEFGVCEFSGRFSTAIQLWDLPRLDDLHQSGRTQAYLLTSGSASVDSDSAEGDFFAASLSNLVYPAVMYAYFDAQADYGLSDDGQSSFSLSASATGMAVVMSKLFQFTDVDNDGVYTKDVDTVVDEYQFAEKELLGYHGPKPSWDRGEFSRESKTAKIKTNDGVFAVTLKANEGTYMTPGKTRMTPNNTKVDIEIEYKDLQEGNLVGLEAYVLSTTAEVGKSLEAGRGLYVAQPENRPMLGFAWDGEADFVADGSKIEVKANGALDASLDELDMKDLILSGMGVKASVDAGAMLECKKMNFVFNQGGAGKVFWDPSIGMGSPEDVSEDNDMMSGASDVVRWTTMLLALFLSATSVFVTAAH
jgi:hypothetical protein